MEWNGMEWNGMEWNGMEWDGMEWNGMEWNGMEWNGMEWNGMEWNGMEWNGMEWNAMQWNGMEWNGMEWNGMEWNGMNDCERLRDVSYTAQCVRGVCLVSVVSVCVLFCGRGVARGLIAPATARTPSLRERPRFARRRIPDTHSPNLCVQQNQDPEPLALTRSAWEPKPRQQGVSILALLTS